ncbi:hypothetical protein N2152v2_003878 [Parachlorella kessleri]
MTEFWVSQKKHWCEYCKVWMQDNPHSRAVHEQGTKHKEAVARKLADMKKMGETQKREEQQTATAMASIEAAAQRQYQADLAAVAQLRKQTLGEWVWNVEAAYYYNAVHRYYYDPKTKMYYGGDPVEWTASPAMPHDARYEVMNKPLPPPSHPPPPSAAAAHARPAMAAGAAGAGNSRTASGNAAAAAAARPGAVRVGMRVAPQHPQAGVGGYQMPEVGRIGGAKGVGLTQQQQQPVGDATKRKREAGAGGKPVSKEEAEALARREAAKQRVQQRTMAAFGLQ